MNKITDKDGNSLTDTFLSPEPSEKELQVKEFEDMFRRGTITKDELLAKIKTIPKPRPGAWGML